MKTPTQSKAGVTRTYIEGAGPVAECAAIGDRALIRLILDSDELVVAAPGDRKPDKSIRRLWADLEHLHRTARERRPESDPFRPNAVDLDLKLRRLDVAVRAQRQLLAGQVIRHGLGGPRLTAVVVLVPRKVDSCLYRLAA